MVILVIHVESVGAFKSETNTPVSRHPNRPSAFTPALEFMKMQARQIHIGWHRRGMESAKYETHSIHMLNLNSACRSSEKETFKALMLEILYHSL